MSDPGAVVTRAVDRLQPLHKAAALSWWHANVEATEEHEQQRVAAELALSDALADGELFRDVEEARANGADGVVRRQLDLLHSSLVPHQVPEAIRHRIVELEASVEARFAQHRGEVGGRPVDDNEIKRILRTSDDVGERREAWEASKTVGAVVEMLGARRAQMMDMQDAGQGMTRMVYIAPTRGLLGFRYQFLTSTRGAGVMHTIFHGYDEMAGPMSTRTSGSLVAWEAGETTAYALKSAEERGTLFLGPGVPVYEGMVVGENARSSDIVVNVCKKKHLTNVRASRGDMEIRLTPPRQMSLDEAIEYLADDELLEVTPESYRIRKRILNTEERGKQTKKAKELLAE